MLSGDVVGLHVHPPPNFGSQEEKLVFCWPVFLAPASRGQSNCLQKLTEAQQGVWGIPLAHSFQCATHLLTTC